MPASGTLRIGVDLGGTKIECIALDDAGTELRRRRVPAPSGSSADTVAAIAELVLGVERELGTTGTVGVGIPGTLSPATGRVKNANSVWLIGAAPDVDLGEALGREVRLANDANCFALSEATDGAAAGAAVVFGVILGTGVGGGVVVDGRVLTGPNAIAGEWGHNPLPWPDDDERPGPPCYCGRHGCLETFLSGPGLTRDFLLVRGQTRDSSDLHDIRDMRDSGAGAAPPSVPEIVARAEAGDAAAGAALERYERRLARGLASVINVLDPDVIVLGGGVSNVERLYRAVPRQWGQWVFSDRVDTRLVPAQHGDSSGVRGAAWLWPARG